MKSKFYSDSKMFKAVSLFPKIMNLTIALILSLNLALLSQIAMAPYHFKSYDLDSGVNDGRKMRGNTPVLAFTKIISVTGATWLRLYFNDFRLGTYSYLKITSLKDGASQRLDAESISQWRNSSAFFNGAAVKVEFFVSPKDREVFFQMDRIMVGEHAQVTRGIETLCGSTDDRTSSSDSHVGRIVPVGCTGWITDAGLHVSAGHCFTATVEADVLEFNIPPSLSDGTIQHPGPEDQYSIIDPDNDDFEDGGIGNDWCVFRVSDNSETGLQPIEAQNASFSVVQDLDPDTLRVTGYGVDDELDNQTQQTHKGSNSGSSSTTMRYEVDTREGNSGSPVIDEATGEAVGVHTNGGCQLYGYNRGTSTYNTDFWNALHPTITVSIDQTLTNGTSTDNVGRWEGGPDFISYSVP